MQITRELVDEYLEKGLCPTPEGPFIQDETGLVIKTSNYSGSFVPEGKLKNRLKYNPLNQTVGNYYSESRPEHFSRLCLLKPFAYPNFKVDPFIRMMNDLDENGVSGYSVMTVDKEDAAIIPIIRGNKNAMTLGFFWENSHPKHRKLCIGIKAQYYLIKLLPSIGIEQLFLRGGTLQYKIIFKPELRRYK